MAQLSRGGTAHTIASWISRNCGLGCFPGYATVLTPGGYVRIDSVKRADTILSWDPYLSQTTIQLVKHLCEYTMATLWEVGLDCGNTLVHMTGSHSVLTTEGWKRVDATSHGDTLLSLDHKLIKLSYVRKLDKKAAVYNIISTGPHNFIVEGGIVAHNFTLLRGPRTWIDNLSSIQVDSIGLRPDLSNGGASPNSA